MSEVYSFPVIAVAYCRNTTENGDWCKSQEETDTWLLNHMHYFAHQDTIVQSDIWEDNEIVDQHPYFGDEKNYFPTYKLLKE